MEKIYVYIPICKLAYLPLDLIIYFNVTSEVQNIDVGINSTCLSSYITITHSIFNHKHSKNNKS